MTNYAPETLQGLYKIPVEELGLSDRVLSLLKWNGIASIWDCIEFYYQDAHDMDVGSSSVPLIMYGEVESRLKEHGYWSYVLNRHVWRVLKQWPAPPHRAMIVNWRGKDEDLYSLPIQQLELSDLALEAAKVARFISIGQCMYYCIWSFRTYPSDHYRAEHNVMEVAAGREGYRGGTMFVCGEAQIRMRELGYWPLIEDSIDNFVQRARAPREFIHPSEHYQHLFDIPIEQLNVSGLLSLKKSGIISVGHYVDFYRRIKRRGAENLTGFIRNKYDEGEQKLKEHGYWDFVKDSLTID